MSFEKFSERAAALKGERDRILAEIEGLKVEVKIRETQIEALEKVAGEHSKPAKPTTPKE